MGGKSPEHEVSLATGKEVVRNLDKKKYTVFPIILPRKKSFSSQIINCRPEVAFIAMHGPFGEDGTIQGMLELAGIPYTGAGVLASALGMDKIMFRKIMEREKISTPRYIVFKKGEKEAKIINKFKFPVFIKPYNQGSSVGASICRQPVGLRKALELAFSYSNPILVEEYLPGLEVSCGVLGNEKPLALPIAEIVPENEFFDYEAKYTPGKSEEIVPARISKKLTKEVQNLATKVFQAIGCRGFGRVDMIIKNNQPMVLEINTIPGLTPVSLFPKEAAAAGISYSQLLDRLIELALENCLLTKVFWRFKLKICEENPNENFRNLMKLPSSIWKKPILTIESQKDNISRQNRS